jgi:protein kinase A
VGTRCAYTDSAADRLARTGTFARVWLAQLANPSKGDENKVFALKILRKVDVIRLKQVEHVRNERNVLAAVAGHPFITTLVTSFQDHDSLYMLVRHCVLSTDGTMAKLV